MRANLSVSKPAGSQASRLRLHDLVTWIQRDTSQTQLTDIHQFPLWIRYWLYLLCPCHNWYLIGPRAVHQRTRTGNFFDERRCSHRSCRSWPDCRPIRKKDAHLGRLLGIHHWHNASDCLIFGTAICCRQIRRRPRCGQRRYGRAFVHRRACTSEVSWTHGRLQQHVCHIRSISRECSRCCLRNCSWRKLACNCRHRCRACGPSGRYAFLVPRITTSTGISWPDGRSRQSLTTPVSNLDRVSATAKDGHHHRILRRSDRELIVQREPLHGSCTHFHQRPDLPCGLHSMHCYGNQPAGRFQHTHVLLSNPLFDCWLQQRYRSCHHCFWH